MITRFPPLHAGGREADDEIKIQMELTFDMPVQIAEQVEMWGLYQFDKCEYDEARRMLRVTAKSTFYRKGA